MKLILVGYMASGKSTIGKTLANVLNYKFIDLDDYIENKESQSVAQIFKTKGEIYFRKVEQLLLKEIINNNDKAVISLGGGTPCFYDTMDWLKQQNKCITIYLNVDLKTLSKRLLNDQNRPLISHLNTEEEIKDFVAKHLFERSFFYNKSEVKIDASQSITKIVEDLILKLF